MKNKSSFSNSNCTINYNSDFCFYKLSEDELTLLEENTREVTYNKGDVICKQNAFSSYIMYVCEGLVKTYIEDENGMLLLRIIPPGGFVGLSSLLEGNSTFHFSASAYMESSIRMFDIEIMRKIINTNAQFASAIINVLCENSHQIYYRFFALSQKQSYGRLADILLCLSKRIYKNDTFELKLSRKELAELSNLSREKVIRILKEFKESNLISIKGKSLKIINIEELQKISDHG